MIIRFLPILLLAASAITSAAAPVDMPVETFDTAYSLGNVTVTAIKQNADLSLQPLAAEVLTLPQIERWNIKNVKCVSEIAPNFYMPSYGSRITSSIYVRGIGSRLEQPAVGMSVDNVTYLSKDNYDFDLNDIERIEILRGPQSTLYGRNTMAGQINIYTIQPLRYQGTRIRAGVANGPATDIGLSHYFKLRESLAMGVSAYFSYYDGFFRNHFNDTRVDSEKSGTLRWKTQWRPRRDVMVENVATFNMSRQSGYPYQYVGSGRVNYNDTCFYRRNAFSDGLTVKWDGPHFSIASITSAQYTNDNMTLDQDFLPLNYFTLTQAKHEWNITQDFVGRGSWGIYKWIAGLFGFYKHTTMRAPVRFKDDAIDHLILSNINDNDHIPVRFQWNEPDILLNSNFTQPVWGLAIYQQSEFDLGRVNINIGQRLDYEHTHLSYLSTCNTSFSAYMKSGVPPVPILTKTIDIDLPGSLSERFLEYVPKLTVSYELGMRSKSTIYASVAKGYKSGGFNTQMFSTIIQKHLEAQMRESMPGAGSGSVELPSVYETVAYKPELSWNYEVGAHIFCAGDRVVTDISFFYIDCRNQQITIFPDAGTTGRITTNAGKTRSYGAEVQISYNPTEAWSFSANYGHTRATFRRYIDGSDNYRGNHVPYAPLNTLFASAAYTHNIAGDWRLTYNLNCRGVGRIYWNEANSISQPFYALLGASVVAHRGWLSVEAWMENIAGHHYDTFYFSSMGNDFIQQGNPRRFGITLRMNFDAK